MLIPQNGKVIVRAYLHGDALAAEVKKRSGLLIIEQKDNKHNFEGVPNRGYIYALPAGYDGELKIGMQIIFDEKSPKGFKYEDQTMFALDLGQIAAIIGE